jgi:hypothetical protein
METMGATRQTGGKFDAYVPAAEYVRMSTEHQRYSTENQSQAIREYAARRRFKIERTYQDSGKSGLSLDGRDALKSAVGGDFKMPTKALTTNTSANAPASMSAIVPSSSRTTAAQFRPSSKASGAPWRANTAGSYQ